MTKAKELFAILMSNIRTYKIADFLFDEIEMFLSSLTYYRLLTIQKNFSDFVEHVCFLSDYYFEKLEVIEKASNDDGTTIVLWTLQNVEKIKLINEVRSFFLLSALEFAQGSTTRIMIKKQAMQLTKNEMNKKQEKNQIEKK